MIKFLHTADLHIGKVFHDQSLLEDQAAMLGDLTSILEDPSYDALLIAGDVYDRSIPSPDAVELFSSFLGSLKKLRPSLEILIVPGNHDSASRLGFGRELFARLGIRFGVTVSDCDKPVIIEKDGERCAFFLLPFLSSQSLIAEAAGRMEKARQEINQQSSGIAKQVGVAYSVLLTHLFASGGEESGSEQLFIGNAERVDLKLFAGFDYIALGHLHRSQSVGLGDKKAWYSGSPLAYSFGEVSIPQSREKSFLSVSFAEQSNVTKQSDPKMTRLEVEKISINPRRKLKSISGPFASFAAEEINEPELFEAKECYLEIRLTDKRITENARDILRRRFPYLLSLRQDEALAGLSLGAKTRASPGRDNSSRRLDEDFSDFLVSLYGEADREELELFRSLLEEAALHDEPN
jgi:exonuclease SbcD